MGAERLRDLAACRGSAGVVSVCSAHALVVEAALREADEAGGSALIEATCNQVNQEGGYSGMTPVAFRDFVHGIADRVGFARERVILGGDHLGPNPWRQLPADEAMERAREMIAAYAAAGFEKLHLDASMACAGDAAALGDGVIARRAAALAAAAEAEAVTAPVYVIGSEVPTPGGATDAQALHPTEPGAVRETWEVHRAAFETTRPAWDRVVAMVVQPGVEFGHDEVAVYEPARAQALARTLDGLPGLVFEAHSTDYQPERALSALVADGFAILKVGPALTFAMRETLYGLDFIRDALRPGTPSLRAAMEVLMRADPGHWRSHGHGSGTDEAVLRHYSLSDRVRYYWPRPEARRAVGALLAALDGVPLPRPLLSQFLPRLADRVAGGEVEATPRALLIRSIRDVLRPYRMATEPNGGTAA